MSESTSKPMAGWIQDLPKVPVPELDKTLERYLASLKPVIPVAQYEQTKRTVEQFLEPDGEGQRLQKELLKFAETTENWVTELWVDDMYLNNPQPLPINSNPFYMLPKQNFRSTTDQLRFAARLIQFCYSFKNQIDNETLEQDFGSGHGRGAPLCMETYKTFFRACRAPGDKKDSLLINDGKSNHFIVASRSQFYSMSLDEEETESEDIIFERLRWIWYMSKENESTAPAVGLLTTDGRRTWAEARGHLIKNPLNQKSLEAIERSLFVICLDDTVSAKAASARSQRRDSIQMARMDPAYMAAQLLAGGGSEYYSANRWFDKFLQFVVGKDGICGVVCEHTASEGITVLRFLDEFQDSLKKFAQLGKDQKSALAAKNSGGHEPSASKNSNIVCLQWELSDIVVHAIQEAAKRINKLIEDLDLYILQFSEFGKQFVKAQRMSPDAFVQLALQLTYYKVHRRLVSTYESAGLRQFRMGRVDTIRAANIEVLSWVKAMCDEIPEITEEHKVVLFQKAMAKQIEVLKYTIAGHGPDNHLLGLREMSRKMSSDGHEHCPLFREKAYSEFLNFRLSTSQLPNEKGVIVGYGAVVPDGYGVSYNPCPSSILFCISSFYSSPETSSDFFARSLEGSLLQMRELCLKLAET